jgi:hypothetical protein
MSSTELVVPDSVEPVIGWRCWGYDPGRGLHSPLQGLAWPAREAVTAKCDVEGQYAHAVMTFSTSANPSPPKEHEAPHAYCNCGIHAAASISQAITDYGQNGFTLCGTVKLWGRVVEGIYGWRGEKAYPDQLWVLSESAERGAMVEHFARLIGDEYAIPVGVATRDELCAMAGMVAPVDVAKVISYESRPKSPYAVGISAPMVTLTSGITSWSYPSFAASISTFKDDYPVKSRWRRFTLQRALLGAIALNLGCAALNLGLLVAR